MEPVGLPSPFTFARYFPNETMAKANTNLGAFPPAPDDMTPGQVARWDLTVRSFPSDWFRASDLPLLVELIRAHDMADQLHQRIAGTADLAELKTLLQLRDAETRRAASLATKLRMPPQSRSDRHLAGRMARDASGNRPWEPNPFDEFDDPADRFFTRPK